MYAETPTYPELLKKFVEKLEEDQQNAKDDETIAIVVFVESGRKFDKVMIARHKKGKVTTEARPRYFIDKRKGNIYGALSPLAPNYKWYFGDLTTVEKWDWSGWHGRPLVSPRDAGVIFVGKYGDYDHYEKINRKNPLMFVTA